MAVPVGTVSVRVRVRQAFPPGCASRCPVLASLHPVRGAEGSGCAGPSTLFLGERREHLQRLILAVFEEATEAALAALLPFQRSDFVEILDALDGWPSRRRGTNRTTRRRR